MNPKLLIGIGSSGMYILENVQRYYYESFKKNSPDNTKYLYIETNKDNRVGVTTLENEISRVFLDLEQLAAMVEELKKENGNEWLPEKETPVQAGLGAGGIRCIGRLALWGRNMKQDNFNTVINAIQNAVSTIARNTMEKPTVFITGSLTGGTGSSVFIDLAYIIRYIIPEIKEVFGLFLLPPDPINIRGNEVIYANTYAALRDLEHYNHPSNFYSENWPNGKVANFANPPYELVQFISQNYSDGAPAIKSLPGLYKIAGLYLFLQISGVKEKRMERLVDASGNSIIGKYGMFGLSAIEYPKEQIQEMVALNLSEELLKRWINPTSFVTNSDPIPINMGNIAPQVEKHFSNILNNACDSLNNVDSRDLLREIEEHAQKINMKKIDVKPEEYIIQLFSSNETGKFYQTVFLNLSNAVTVIISGIYDKINEALNRTENLHYTKQYLIAFSEAIQASIQYVQERGIPEAAAIWDNVLQERAKVITKNLYRYVFEEDKVLADRMIETLEMMKMHLLINRLQILRNNITSTSALPITTNIGKRVVLPQIEFFNGLISAISNVVDIQVAQGENLNIMTITKRKSDVIADINDETIPVKRVYQFNNLDTEVKNATQNYQRNLNRMRASKRDIIGEEHLFPFLSELLTKNFQSELYARCIRQYRRVIDENGVVPDYDVTTVLLNEQKLGEQYARRALTNLIRLRENFTNAHPPTLPRFIACSDVEKVTRLINGFQGNNFNEFVGGNDGILLQDHLKNMVVFYNEDPLPDPLSDISYRDQMKAMCEKKPAWIRDPSMSDELWVRYRNAYAINKLPEKKKNSDEPEVKS